MCGGMDKKKMLQKRAIRLINRSEHYELTNIRFIKYNAPKLYIEASNFNYITDPSHTG